MTSAPTHRLRGSELLVLDFDGVLAPIGDDPALTRMADDVARALTDLADAVAGSAAASDGPAIVVLSGRPAAFLAEHACVPGVLLLGSYGAEEVVAQPPDGHRIHLDPSVQPWIGAVRRAEDDLKARFATSPGLRIESKPVSVAVHWRQAPDRERAAADVRDGVAAVGAAHGLRVEPGKFVLELLAPVPIDKGRTLQRLLADLGPRSVTYIGDDLGDLPALQVARDVGGEALVVRHGEETPAALEGVASRVLNGVRGVAAELSARAARASAPSG